MTLFGQRRPTYVINCAAYTAVDKAEDDIELCRGVNKTGAFNVAEACKAFGAVLIHVSTDFVFEGNGHDLLGEEDLANPVNIYGLTKLEGEQAVVRSLPEHFIVRTSCLYSEYGNNFVKAMLKFGAERDELNIIADQVGTPSYAIDLAGVILRIIESGSTDFGIYHYSNERVYVVKEQFDRLHFCQREFENRPCRKSATRFDLKRRKNREVMTDFIDAELNYLRKQQQPEPAAVTVPDASAQVASVNTSLIAGYKIRFLLSVDALAYFFKLMVQATMVDAGVRTELLAFVARVFLTPGAGSNGISAGSLGVKYKQVVQSTAMNVRAALMRMVRLIDDEFGAVR
jgi:dTDP-4-dehydrorhamnose reductase